RSGPLSAGEDAYSLPIAVEQFAPSYPQAHGEIFATDVRSRALMDASQARYNGDSLREVAPQTLERYFERGTDSTGESDGTHVVIADVRRRVTFRRVNLLERAYWRRIPNRFDLIVSSNLLPFFPTPTP